MDLATERAFARMWRLPHVPAPPGAEPKHEREHVKVMSEGREVGSSINNPRGTDFVKLAVSPLQTSCAAKRVRSTLLANC
jgi:hypothetical protein